jgi:hypothetical protein
MTQCLPLARGKMMRLTRLDECGAPVPGPTGSLVTKGFIQVVSTPVYQDQEDITQTDANGDNCIDDQSDPALRWFTLQMDFCNIDPDAINIITGAPLILNDAATPESIGFSWDAETLGTANFALELWAGVAGQACSTAGFKDYGYMLYPYVVQAQINEYTVANAALTLSMTARTSTGSLWDVGPYADVMRSAVTPATLTALTTPIRPTEHGRIFKSSAPLPTPSCGAVELPAPTP